MTNASNVTSERYSIGRSRGDERFVGHDSRLGRDVLLWVVPVANDEERDGMLALGAECARLDHPVFLQTLDLVDQPDRVTIVLEAAADVEATAEHPLAGGLPALVAATLTLRIGAALDEAASRGLVARELPLTYVHVSGADEVRLDPVGLFGDPAESDDGLVPLLTEFLASFLPGGERAGLARSRFDPGAEAATSLVGRWRERAARGNADDLGAFLDELRLITRAPADYYVEADAGFKRPANGAVMVPSVPADEEVTVPLPLNTPIVGPGRTTAPGPRREPRPQVRAPSEAATVANRRQPRRSGVSFLVTLIGFGLMAALAGVLLWVGLGLGGGDDPSGGASPDVVATAPASPTPAPADRATLSLTAQRDAQVRISVDGTVQYTGVLRANETRSWEGGNRVQVWTDNGKNLLVTVNGFPLGALSPAVGHPDWNTVDWGWPAGWRPAQ